MENDVLAPVHQARPRGGKAQADHLRQYLGHLSSSAGDPGCYSPSFSPYPIVVRADEIAQFKRLRHVLHKALVGIVSAWFDDSRIGGIIKLAPPYEALLKNFHGRPYRVGSFRPDLLLDLQGQWRICEINGRFPLNGYLVSFYNNEILERLDYLEPGEMIPRLNTLIDQALSRLAEPVTLVKELDQGREIFMFTRELERRGISWIQCSPAALSVEGGCLQARGRTVGSLIWEVKREELLSLSSEVVNHLQGDIPNFNDLRTQILVHDKRMLAVLQTPEIVEAFLSADELAFLNRFMIPTFNAGATDIAVSLHEEREQWLLKPNSSGRGKGILVGHTLDQATWSRALQRKHEYTAQRFLEQQTTPITYFQGERPTIGQFKLVAMLPGFDDVLLGPGFFRASDQELINLHGSGGTLVPAMLGS